jgi:glycerol-3-phosphate dehydrogenase (NAD(P)+)
VRIAILGAGAWGTALASHAAARHPVVLWSRNARVVADIDGRRRNQRYLPEHQLPESLVATADMRRAVADADLLVVATSVAGLRPVVTEVVRLADGGPARPRAITWLCKGLEADTGALPHAVVASIASGWAAGCLSGPSFAQEVAAGLPAALTAAATEERLALQLVEAFHHGPMRVYRSADLVGVEIAGALKNVMAIATGIADGLDLGMNARAALLTRGLAEVTRFGLAHGAQAETFMGLAGVGDLVLTCTGDLSRNRRVGLQLAAGVPLPRILADLGHVAEGVACCQAVVARARADGLELPVSEAVLAVIEGRITPADAVAGLLAREPKAEGA